MMPTREEYLSANTPKPKPFAVGEQTVLLRSVTYGERAALIAWNRDHKDDPDAGFVLFRKLAALALCDDAGRSVLSEDEVAGLDPKFVDAVGEEAGRRCGLYADDREKKVETTSDFTSPAGAD